MQMPRIELGAFCTQKQLLDVLSQQTVSLTWDGHIVSTWGILKFSFPSPENFTLLSRVRNKPYDVFGCWLNETNLISGNLHRIGYLTSCSVLWLNNAFQVRAKLTASGCISRGGGGETPLLLTLLPL